MRINHFLGELVKSPAVMNEFSYNFVICMMRVPACGPTSISFGSAPVNHGDATICPLYRKISMRINHFLGELVKSPAVMNEFSYNFVLFGRPSTNARARVGADVDLVRLCACEPRRRDDLSSVQKDI
jgi:hypothetical protein